MFKMINENNETVKTFKTMFAGVKYIINNGYEVVELEADKFIYIKNGEAFKVIAK